MKIVVSVCAVMRDRLVQVQRRCDSKIRPGETKLIGRLGVCAVYIDDNSKVVAKWSMKLSFDPSRGRYV